MKIFRIETDDTLEIISQLATHLNNLCKGVDKKGCKCDIKWIYDFPNE